VFPGPLMNSPESPLAYQRAGTSGALNAGAIGPGSTTDRGGADDTPEFVAGYYGDESN